MNERMRSVKADVLDVKAVIVGDGPEMGRLKSLVSELELGKNVLFLGFLEDYNRSRCSLCLWQSRTT